MAFPPLLRRLHLKSFSNATYPIADCQPNGTTKSASTKRINIVIIHDLMIGRRNEAASRATTPISIASRCGCFRLTLAMRLSSAGGAAFAFSSCSIRSSSFCALFKTCIIQSTVKRIITW